MIDRDLTLLVVDDVREITEVFRKLAERMPQAGLRIITHTDPRAAIADIEREPIDAVISDLRMPFADGVEVLCAALRWHPRARRVLMTGYNEIPVDAQRLATARIDAFVTKPIEAHAAIILMWDILVEDGPALQAMRSQARSFEAALAAEAKPPSATGEPSAA